MTLTHRFDVIDELCAVRVCSVDGCDRPHKGRGYCESHFRRFKRIASPHAEDVKIKRKVQEWMDEHKGWSGDGCLTWPFRKDKYGRGLVQFRGKHMPASRAMCFLAHGEPPHLSYEAAHSCGKGNDACVSPLHLSWKTHTENEADKRIHGTLLTGERSCKSKLTEAQVREIRRLSASTSQTQLAKTYGVSQPTISLIVHNINWKDCA